jgi:hypothetical protein
MMHNEAEARTAARRRPLKHFEVVVGIPKGSNKPATDDLATKSRMAFLDAPSFHEESASAAPGLSCGRVVVSRAEAVRQKYTATATSTVAARIARVRMVSSS